MAAPRAVVCLDGKGGHRLIETFCVVFYQITASKLIKLIRSGPSTRPPRTPHNSLRGYSDMMEGRGDLLERLNLGRSIDHSCNVLQHLWVGIGVVSVCIGFVLPQTDRNHIHGAGI